MCSQLRCVERSDEFFQFGTCQWDETTDFCEHVYTIRNMQTKLDYLHRHMVTLQVSGNWFPFLLPVDVVQFCFPYLFEFSVFVCSWTCPDCVNPLLLHRDASLDCRCRNYFQICRLAANIFKTSSLWPPTRKCSRNCKAATSPSCISNIVVQTPVYGIGILQILFVTSTT